MNSMKFVFSMSFLIAASLGASRIDKRGADFGFSNFGPGYSFAQDLPSIPVGPWVPAESGPWASGSSGPWISGSSNPWAGQTVLVKNIPSIQSHLSPYHQSPSPTEIATAVAAAKDASSSVQHAQQRVQVAKEAVLEAQKIASIKESQANLALKQSEAAAAVQRQSASAAANAVIQAQQRLAEAKAEVAQRQRLAAAKEAIAAIVIGKSANAAAAEIQRTEHTANKIAAIQRSEAQAAIQHVSATKDASLAGVAAAVSATNNAHSYGPSGPAPGPQYPGKKAPFIDYPWGK